MAGRTDDRVFLQKRAESLLKATLDTNQDWQRKSRNRATKEFRVLVPEDGEDYLVRMSLIRVGPRGDRRHVLVSHETGLFAATYKLRSRDYGSGYNPLDCLGLAVFGRA